MEDMNQGLISIWNDTVKQEDTVYVLGDFAFCGAKKLVEIVQQINGTKHLIIGNHDTQNFKCHRAIEYGFASAREDMLIDIPILGSVRLNHFPYLHGDTDQRTKLRYLDKRPQKNGKWLFHGHIHNGQGSWRITEHMVNVGVDVWDYRPVSVDVILKNIDFFSRNGYDNFTNNKGVL